MQLTAQDQRTHVEVEWMQIQRVGASFCITHRVEGVWNGLPSSVVGAESLLSSNSLPDAVLRSISYKELGQH